MPPHRPALLVILDGFALGEPDHPCNAVAIAPTPCLDRLLATCPWTEIRNNEHHVGLPDGQMGNSEVGHMNIGAGRVLYQDFLRINRAIADGSYARNPALQEAFQHARAHGGRLHVMGLLGPGGVHAHEDHLAATLRAAAAASVSEVWIHPILDGRDTDPRSADAYLQTLERQVHQAGIGRVADIVGRYWAMDRDKRWERTKRAYDLFTGVQAAHSIEHDVAHPTHNVDDARTALAQAYARGEDDEFVAPTRIEPEGAVRSGDAVVWLNFRPDRSRQMTRAFMDRGFDGFERERLTDVLWVCMTQYDDAFATWRGVRIAYPPDRPTGTLGEHIAELGLRQLRIAETEKYAHVTYFLNGGREEPFAGEERILVPSPQVATYDLQPEMSAGEVTDRILHALGSEVFDLIVVNYANPDMVGHTGNLDAAVQMMAFMDNCLDRLTQTATSLGYVTLITSDHGNCEQMCRRAADGGPGDRLTNHTMGPSPLIVVGAQDGITLGEGGALCNVAPTLLDLMGLPPAPQMEAKSLVVRKQA